MPQLSKERILEWQKILKEDYGREISFAEAAEAANNLVGFFSLLLKVDMRINPQNYTKKATKVSRIKNKEQNYE